jgi:hypothetical protein
MTKINQPPIGIILTMGARVIAANRGLRNFITHFTSCCKDEDSGLWLQKSRACPKQDIAHIYLILCNRLWGRVYYGGYCKEPRTVWMLDGEQRLFPWPHMMLAGPFERAPVKIPMRGFQGFRYVYDNLW